jgi:hypothetical protein
VSERGRLTDWLDIHRFVFGGNATFTLAGKTERYTFKVTALKEARQDGLKIWFVSLLRGPDNESDYTYMGVLKMTSYDAPSFHRTAKSRVAETAQSWVAFKWFVGRMNKGGEPCTALEFWHEGRCCRCGRKLTVPGSVKRGIGPECAVIAL